MALTFNGIEPVGFGPEGRRKICTPKMNAELRLRVANLQFKTDADIERANSILAECFPDDRDFVFDFLTNEMTAFDKEILQTFLLNGVRAVEQIQNSIDNGVKQIIDDIVVKELKKASDKVEESK